MIKILMFLTLLLMNNLYATFFSIQYGAFRNKNYAYDYKNRNCNEKCFIYINRNYYTVREGIFSNIKYAKKYAVSNKLKNYIIVPINLTQLGIKEIVTKNNRKKSFKKSSKKCVTKLEKKLTPCRNGICNKNRNKKYPWEYDVTSLKVDLNVSKTKINENSLITKNSNFNNNKNEFLRYYFDIYGKAFYGQKKYKENTRTDFGLVGKVGVQYGVNFLDNYHFYTDDRLIFDYDNYMNKASDGIYFDIHQFYLNSYNLFYNMFNFVVGRKIVKDYNSLFYNSPMDLVGFYNLHDLLLYKIYLGTRFDNFKIKDDDNNFGINTKNIKFLIAEAQYEFYLEHYINFLYQYENSYNSNVFEKRKGNWISLRSYNTDYNENGDKLFYYGNIATLNGKKENQNYLQTGTELFGGFMYEPSKWINRGVGASFAYASKNYFQPYIANNKSNFLSKNLSFRYFGEFLDPELSNIDILSLYYKNIIDNNSLYLVSLHKYWKNSDKDIYASRYIIPTGIGRDVGQELDFLYKYLENNYYWQFALSYFLGGNAFDKVEKKDGIGAKINFRYFW